MWLYDEDGKQRSVNPSDSDGECPFAVAPGAVLPYRANCIKTFATVKISSARVLIGANKVPSVPYVTNIETTIVAGQLITAGIVAAKQADEASVKRAADVTKNKSKVDL